MSARLISKEEVVSYRNLLQQRENIRQGMPTLCSLLMPLVVGGGLTVYSFQGNSLIGTAVYGVLTLGCLNYLSTGKRKATEEYRNIQSKINDLEHRMGLNEE
ncbi:hypothetical protein HYX13_01110 [Candidatus Woesearchaeota archaeon]|nr:hypothetical protein [Candidatus Woesearchaeota archaeon]